MARGDDFWLLISKTFLAIAAIGLRTDAYPDRA
jgi:hypothetical protein